jgi:pimeloyl-ACP methyl ester carboxylesterase
MSRGPAGRMVSIGTHRLHLHCVGSGDPVVVFDAALGGSALSWTLVQPEVARISRACAYDRAGFGWSEAGPMPRTAGRIAAELHELLRRANVPPPYVLVGHSFGGLVVQLFAMRYRSDTAGLVLVDPAHPEDWVSPDEYDRQQMARGVRLCRRGEIAARLGLARVVAALVALGALSKARTFARILSRSGLRPEDEDILAPMWKLPREVRRSLLWYWTRPKFFQALGSQIETVCESAREVAESRSIGFGDLPLITISASNTTTERLGYQEQLSRLSSRGRHVVAAAGGHWVPLDEPRTVIDAVLEVVGAARIRSM